MSKVDVATERKDQIVRATVECIAKYGYNNFSMQDVARTAGVSKGIIHYYFLNKDELMRSVLDKVAGDIGSVLEADIESIADPIKKLETFINIGFDIVQSTKEYYQVNMDFWTQINQKEDVKNIIVSHYQKFRITAARIISEGIVNNVFRKVDPIEYASYIIAVIDGLSLQWLFDENAFNYDSLVKNITKEILDNLIIKKDGQCN